MKDDSGAAAVEFALVFPLVVAMLFGVVDLGFALNAKIALTQAAQEGARALALGGDEGAALARVDAALAATGQLRAYQVDLTPCAGPGSTGSVVVSGRLAPTIPLVDDFDLESGAAMRCSG